MRYLYMTALVASLIGLIASLVAHIRSLLGFGCNHWVAPFVLIFVLFAPYILALDGIVHGGVTGWRKNPPESIFPSTSQKSWFGIDFFEHQQRWSQALVRRPAWMKKLNYLVAGYFFTAFMIRFFLTTQRNEWPTKLSIATLPPPIAFLCSSCWVACYWLFFSTFWQVMHPDSEAKHKM
jgi:hypothetical protein